jgi:hypothetical protein
MSFLAKRAIRESAVGQQTSYPTKRPAVGSGSRPSIGKNFPPVPKNQKPPVISVERCTWEIAGREAQVVSSVVKLAIS